ncbi:helix-turn-helix domain-containing protein [Streptomyces sp. WAC05374]|uniref:BTAD domain-containing putative transcriptional regulator n=1 Tax=Streptomyces sp. WAC05374 TaxID=2487420 RepID=UPI000F87279F|nr:BTAD domain-containing putative transcriptional regulator [Streptomyces sp. WAC05374]RST16948.1 helix-turn-helix domain-containing protein [Streptomyces sp. WAC05374]TDF43453.1 helix-turn-helix domain-containing protein [Streptomyces sp. WAC05374]TDF51648.1 helix-turn-helix domain-containing protein [Streptomyces sp. WAC05374]TDF53199.1 helix-turn-helix domain-containing protein [Streptomyces sp. WAC05374]
MRVGLLGSLVFDTGTGPLPVGGAKLRALLVRLALDAGRAVRPGTLVEDLWGDTPPADPVNALQSLVSRLRGLAAGPSSLVHGPTGYRLAVEPAAVDALRFAELARTGHELLARSRPDEAAEVLREALGLWRGPALADVHGAPFAAGEAERLARARLAALGDRIGADLARGATGPALVAEVQALTARHPLHEGLHAQLIRALAATGRNAEALAVHAELRARLADTFGADPGPDVTAAHLAVLRAPAAPLPPARRAQEPPGPRVHGPSGNPDTCPTSFVGRGRDVRRVTGLLGRVRLVTLVGPGGAGKTRLAQVCARELAPPDGVWCVGLAPVGAGGVPGAVLDVLRARGGRAPARAPADRAGSGPEEAVAALVEAVAGEKPLLLLDNCEHVVDEAARLVAALLARCPGLRVLATGRQPLRIDGEHLHNVGPLELPAPGSPTGRARACAAVRLFEDRAAAVAPGFTVDDTSVGAVSEICRRLDGLPLAIELAAARLRTLPLAAVAARLDDRFRLLTGGSRAALPRHRTLRAVMAWSWELLEPGERTLLERLAAVPGGVTEDAAAAVGGLGGDVQDLLASLVDKSLLHLAGTADAAEPRYTMAETVREYGRERLASYEGPGPARDRHAAFFLRLAEAAEPLLRTRDQVDALGRLTAERDHLHAALRRWTGTGDAAGAVRLAAALGWFWHLRGNPPESVELLGRVLAVPGPSDPVAYVRVVAAHALAVQATGLPRQTEEAFERFGRVAGDAAHDPHPLTALARLALAVASPGGAGGRLVPGPAGDDAWERAFGLLTSGLLALHTGDPRRAADRLASAARGFEATGERWGLAVALSSHAGLVGLTGDLSRVRAMNERAYDCFAQLGLRAYSIENEMSAALLRARTGDVPGGRRDLEELLEQVLPGGAAEPVALVRLGLAWLEWWAGRWELARAHAEAGLAGTGAGSGFGAGAGSDSGAGTGSGRRPPAHLAALLRAALARIDAAEGGPGRAAARLDDPAVRQLLGWDTSVAARIAAATADIAFARGDAEGAARLLGAATALRGAEDLGDEDVRALTGRVTGVLGPAGFTAAYAAGKALSRAGARDLVGAALAAARAPGAAPGTLTPDVPPQPS